MTLRIHTNVVALGVHRHLEATARRMQDHVRRLSSGLRIESAADDPAGLGVSERHRARSRSLAAAARSAQDGIGFVRTGLGALDAMGEQLVRLRELALRYGNGALSDADRATIEAEYLELAHEVGRIATEASFNGIELFGRSGRIDIQVGADAGETIDVRIARLRRMERVLVRSRPSLPGGPGETLQAVDRMGRQLEIQRGHLAAAEVRLGSALRSATAAELSTAEAGSRVRDVDLAAETTDMARDRILGAAGVAVLAQANVQPAIALRLLEKSAVPARSASGVGELPGPPAVGAPTHEWNAWLVERARARR